MRNQQLKDPKIVALIHNVRSHPALYDYRLPGNHDEGLKDEIWKQVAATCGMQNSGEAKMYWKNLHHSFTVFYRNELIRLIRANYDEQVIGTIPEETKSPKEELFGNRPWGYYSDMRFIAPFRVKGIDPELDRLIELAKPIVRSEAHRVKLSTAASGTLHHQPPSMGVAVDEEPEPPMMSHSAEMNPPPMMSHSAAMNLPTTEREEVLLDLGVPPIDDDQLSLDGACLRGFFDSLYRSTSVLPRALQRRVKREMLRVLHEAEAVADEMTMEGDREGN